MARSIRAADALTDPPRERFPELAALPVRVVLGSFVAEMLGWGLIPGKPWRNWLHAHAHYEICYAFTGRGTFRMLGVDHRIGRGQVFIAKPGEEHEIVSDDRAPLGIYFWTFTLVPNADRTAADAAVDRLVHAFITSRRWVGSRVPGMLRTLESLTEEIARAEAGCASVIDGLTRKLLLDTARAVIDRPILADLHERSATDDDALVALARRYITDNLARSLSVRDIAAQVGLSERHFSRVFRRLTGTSSLECLVECRVHAAAQLLLDPTLAIKDIAARVGFADVRYFTTVFRRATGSPPAAFRERGGTRYRDPARRPVAPGPHYRSRRRPR